VTFEDVERKRRMLCAPCPKHVVSVFHALPIYALNAAMKLNSLFMILGLYVCMSIINCGQFVLNLQGL
jgi:hypothetical protein